MLFVTSGPVITNIYFSIFKWSVLELQFLAGCRHKSLKQWQTCSLLMYLTDFLEDTDHTLEIGNENIMFLCSITTSKKESSAFGEMILRLWVSSPSDVLCTKHRSAMPCPVEQANNALLVPVVEAKTTACHISCCSSIPLHVFFYLFGLRLTVFNCLNISSFSGES